MIGFTIFTPQPLLACCGRPSKTVHWPAGCSATTTTLCWLGHTSFPNKTKHKSDFVLSLTSLNTLVQIMVMSFPYQPLWHSSSDFNSCYFFWVRCCSSMTFLPKVLERESQNGLSLLPITKSHPFIPLTRGPHPLYWLGIDRWCLSLVCMLHFLLNPLLF